MINTCYLRVYLPLAAFSESERGRFHRASDVERPESEAQRWLVSSALPQGTAYPAKEGAFVRRIEGEVLLCPWRTRLRMLVGLLAFRGAVPEEVADAFVPEAEARKAAEELASLGQDHPEIRSHILHANWHVPLRWFAAFDDSERILTEDAEGLRVRYETTLQRAGARLTQAIEILDTSWIDEGIVGSLKELMEWLEQFGSEGLLELDYGTVAQMFPDDELVDDRSASDVWNCLEYLSSGDTLRAGRLFGDLSERWTAVRAREVVN